MGARRIPRGDHVAFVGGEGHKTLICYYLKRDLLIIGWLFEFGLALPNAANWPP
jgi:hypothetical protein